MKRILIAILLFAGFSVSAQNEAANEQILGTGLIMSPESVTRTAILNKPTAYQLSGDVIAPVVTEDQFFDTTTRSIVLGGCFPVEFDTTYRTIKYYDADYNLKVAPDAMVISTITGYRTETYSCSRPSANGYIVVGCAAIHTRKVPELRLHRVYFKGKQIPLKNIVE